MLQLTRILALFGVVTTVGLTGCSDKTPAASNGNAAHSADDGHDHDHEAGDNDHVQPGDTDDHEGHDHGAGDDDQAHAGDAGGHDHGSEHDLGSVTIGRSTLKVVVSGAVEPNGEVHVDIVQTAGPTPAAVRLWIGKQSGTGSLKTKADGHDTHFHGHAEVPSPVPGDAALWIEVETASGEKVAGSLRLP